MGGPGATGRIERFVLSRDLTHGISIVPLHRASTRRLKSNASRNATVSCSMPETRSPTMARIGSWYGFAIFPTNRSEAWRGCRWRQTCCAIAGERRRAADSVSPPPLAAAPSLVRHRACSIVLLQARRSRRTEVRARTPRSHLRLTSARPARDAILRLSTATRRRAPHRRAAARIAARLRRRVGHRRGGPLRRAELRLLRSPPCRSLRAAPEGSERGGATSDLAPATS